MYKNRPNKVEVSELLQMIPSELLEDLASQYQIDWNVSRLRGEVMLNLLLLGIARSKHLSTRVLEYLYNSPFFEALSSKDEAHQTRHSSIAARLIEIDYRYFQALFEWALGHFSQLYGGNKMIKKVNRFDSTLIAISSSLVDWGYEGRYASQKPPSKGTIQNYCGDEGFIS